MKTVAEYLKSSAHCPNCNSEDIVGGFVEIDSDGAHQQVTCQDCWMVWMDVYTLTGMEIVQEAE